MAVFLWAKFVDEEEYEEYLSRVFGHVAEDGYELAIFDEVRDDEGQISPGCYRVRPCPGAD